MDTLTKEQMAQTDWLAVEGGTKAHVFNQSKSLCGKMMVHFPRDPEDMEHCPECEEAMNPSYITPNPGAPMTPEADFVVAWNLMQDAVHTTATKSEFWHHGVGENAHYNPAEHNKSEKIMLMVSELAEAQDGLRHGNPASDKIPVYSNVEEELADCVIRIMDFAAAYDFDVAGAIIAKNEMNKSRPPKHGKAF
jgi:NTP pyrophosphatase (non-canonical NTP hydrolase)